MKKKLIFIIIGVILVYAAYIFVDSNMKKKVIDKNTTQTIENIHNVKSDTIKISDIIDFEWDEAYKFAPYIPRKYQEIAMGKQRGVVFITPNEPDTCLAFLNEGKVVCYIAGDTDDLGFDITYVNLHEGDYYSTFERTDDLSFKIEDNDDHLHIYIK